MYQSGYSNMKQGASAPIVEQIDLTYERTLKEKLQRQLLEIEIALERGELELCEPIEARLTHKVMSLKAEYLATPEKIKHIVFTTYGIDVDINYLNKSIEDTLTKLAHLGETADYSKLPTTL